MLLSNMLISLDAQILLDTMIQSMALQGRSCNSYTVVAQRLGAPDLHCAVGYCLTPAARDFLLRHGRNRDPVRLLQDFSVPSTLVAFLAAVQAANDSAHTRQHFRDEMWRVAQHFSLATHALDYYLNGAWCAAAW